MRNQIEEACACGAKFQWAGDYTSVGNKAASLWRVEHRHDMPTTLAEQNLRILKHEAETDMRGHDEDGACCRAAKEGV